MLGKLNLTLIKTDKKYRQWARLSLVLLGLITLFLGYKASQLEFDYDFEKFFPEHDDDLEFYKAYRSTFENDNDFILIGLRNEGGIFNQTFLEKVESFSKDLETLPHIREVISPLQQKYLTKSLLGFDFKENYFFHPDDPSLYAQDSLRLIESKEPIAEMVSFENNSIILVLKNIQVISKEKSDELAQALYDLIAKQNFDEIHMIGKIIGQRVYINVMRDEFIFFTLLVIIVLLLFLIAIYRSFWGVLVPITTVLLAIITSLGFMQLSGIPLNMMTTLLPILMLVVGMSDVVHLVSKYLEEIRLKRTKIEALKNMLKKVGMATLLTSITTALGFITLVWVKVSPVQDFGMFTASGVIIAFIISILFIPSVFMLMNRPRIVNSKKIINRWEVVLGKLFILISRKRKQLLWFYMIITVCAFVGASQIKFDYYLMQDIDGQEPLMKELKFFQDQFGGIRPFELAVIPKGDKKITDYEVIKEVEKLENYLDEVYQVNQMLGPTLPYKYANRLLRNQKDDYYKVPDNPKRYQYLNRQLDKLVKDEQWQQLISQDKKIGRIFGRLIDPGSREILQRNEQLEKYYKESINSEIIDYKLTGTAAIVDKSGRYVSKNIIVGLLIAFGIIGLFMGLLFRSIKMAFLSLIPNMFPILLTAGLIGFVGINLNVLTSIVFTIAFGIAVDDTIHFLSRYRQEMLLGRNRIYALRRTFISTGKAIIITTLILLSGFGSLLFSDFLSTFYIGLFVSMTLVFAVITDLTLLPLLLLGTKQKK